MMAIAMGGNPHRQNGLHLLTHGAIPTISLISTKWFPEDSPLVEPTTL
jgi:hypothetical protein